MKQTPPQPLPPTEVTVGALAHGLLPRATAHLSREPFWLRDAPLRTAPPAQVLPRCCDVAVIGAGYTGLSAALTLARRGRDVLVLDALEPGSGASTRNGGQVGSGNQKFRVRRLIEI